MVDLTPIKDISVGNNYLYTVKGYIWFIRDKIQGQKDGKHYVLCSCMISDNDGYSLIISFWDKAAHFYSEYLKVRSQ